jgi:hypothetical protein
MELTEIEKDHKLLMRNIVQSLADTPSDEDAYNEDLLVNTKIELDALILSLSENINM